jgi:hypothetical protein
MEAFFSYVRSIGCDLSIEIIANLRTPPPPPCFHSLLNFAAKILYLSSIELDDFMLSWRKLKLPYVSN